MGNIRRGTKTRHERSKICPFCIYLRHWHILRFIRIFYVYFCGATNKLSANSRTNVSNYGQTLFPSNPPSTPLNHPANSSSPSRPPRRRQIELTFCGVQFANPDGHTDGQNKGVGRFWSQSSTASDKRAYLCFLTISINFSSLTLKGNDENRNNLPTLTESTGFTRRREKSELPM